MTEEEAKKANNLVQGIKLMEKYITQIEEEAANVKVYLMDIPEDKRKDWKERNKAFFQEIAEQMKKELEAM